MPINIDAASLFSPDYRSARAKFLAAAKDSGFSVTSLTCPNVTGPDGLGLFTDVAWQPRKGHQKLLLTTSGIHGVEGFAGSAIQTGVMRSGLLSNLAEDTSVVHVHALNPYGFAHLRRVNEGNIDLNRNFIDRTRPVPTAHPLSAEIQDILLPERYEWPQKAIGEFIQKHGMQALQDALQGGQYDLPDGLFYGGHTDAWSNITWHQIIKTHAVPGSTIAHIDFHTGLGASGHGTILLDGNGSDFRSLKGKEWWSDVTTDENTDSVSSPITGSMSGAFKTAAAQAQVVTAALEFGTFPVLGMLRALVDDNWLHAKGRVGTGPSAQIKQQIRDAFNPPDPVWQGNVIERGLQVLAQAGAGLSREPT